MSSDPRIVPPASVLGQAVAPVVKSASNGGIAFSLTLKSSGMPMVWRMKRHRALRVPALHEFRGFPSRSLNRVRRFTVNTRTQWWRPLT